MTRRVVTLSAVVGLALVACQPKPDRLSASGVFEVASPSVVTVKTYEVEGTLDGKEIQYRVADTLWGQGSGVVIGPEQVVSNCHVVRGGDAWKIQQGAKTFDAGLAGSERRGGLLTADYERDLCILQVPGLELPAAKIAEAKSVEIGDSVFAIGAPQGLELSISEGIVSGRRGETPAQVAVLQTTAAISPGSSGGGLFDSAGRLVGITTAKVRGGEGLNFAIPAEWIAEAPARTQALREAYHRATTGDRLAQRLKAKHLNDWATLLRIRQEDVKLLPYDDEAWVELGIALRQQGFPPQWLNLTETFAWLDRNGTSLGTGKGAALTLSIEAIRRGIDLEPHAAYWAELGRSYEMRSFLTAPRTANAPLFDLNSPDVREAVKSYENAMAMKPQWIDPVLNLGLLMNMGNEYARGMELATKALLIDPNDFRAWAIRGGAADGLGRPTESFVAYERVTQLDPENALGWLEYAGAAQKLGRYDIARRARGKLRSIDPELANMATASGPP